MSRYGGSTIFVGNLPGDVREREVEDIFYKYGRIVHLDLKTPPRPPAFAFVEFEDPRDAQDAVAGRDNYDFHGNRLRVEVSHGRARDRGGYGGGGGYDRPRGYGGGGGGGMGGYGGDTFGVLERSRNKGSAYRAIVKGLPASASWQDLKDHVRKVVTPSYTNVVRDRGGAMGIVEFDSSRDLDIAIRKLDDTEFRNPFDRGYIRVIEDDEGRGRKRDRSRSRSRSRGRSYSRSYSRSRSRSRASRSLSRSPRSSRSKSRSASQKMSRSRSMSRSKSKSKSRSPSRSKSKSRSASPAKSEEPQAGATANVSPGRDASPQDN